MRYFKNVLIVIGCTPKSDGRPSNCMLSRIRKAVQLCRKHNYSKIILSGGPTRIRIPESEVMRIMMLNFVQPSRMLIERHSKNTVQNAVFCWEMIKEKKPKQITIVTSEHHMPRARYIFKNLYSHMGVSLRFEHAQDTFDPIASIFYRLKECLLLLWLKIFGFR